MDSVFIERIWRSVKSECLYLRELETGSQASKILGDWFLFYNEQRPHTAKDLPRRKPFTAHPQASEASKPCSYCPGWPCWPR